ncbi:MAG TPA: acyl-CoA dehydrogenase family protein [Tepidisphaeraceae bacterium]|nr:acyl-CoA dehydrogenase family protein [Tepidisphaeraceae bacterium]
MIDQSLDRFDYALARIAIRAQANDQTGAFPADDLADLTTAGAMAWAVPKQFGGDAVDPLELHLRYERLAVASLATALVFTQRDSAIGLIDAVTDSPLRDELLPPLAEGLIYATIGIAQLTTSRHGGLTATPTNQGYRLDGTIPWSTGAAHAKYVVAGAEVCDRSGQVLFVLPTDLPNLRIDPPMPLVALWASWTTSIQCDGVRIADRLVLRGPVPNALAGRRKGVALSQAFLALGLCQAGLDLMTTHESSRAAELHSRFSRQLAILRRRVIDLPEPEAAVSGPELRGQVNDLALRITHSAVALFKGHGLLMDHPAQRLAREALFLLVWSCPDPVIECTVDILASARGEPV